MTPVTLVLLLVLPTITTIGAQAPAPLRIGAHVSLSQYGGTSDPQASLGTLEDLAGLSPGGLDAHRVYLQWTTVLGADGAVPPPVRDSLDQGRLVIASFNTRFGRNPDGSSIDWGDIASGRYDARISDVARGYASLARTGRLMMTFSAEPQHAQNVDKGQNDGEIEWTGTREEFRAAFVRVSNLWRAEAPATIWYFCGEDWNMSHDSYWIGLDPWVPPRSSFDVVGMDIYDFSANTTLAKDAAAERAKAEQHAPGKPHVMPEFGTDRSGADQGRWLRQAIPYLRGWALDPEEPLLAASYFDSGGEALEAASHPAIRELANAFSAPACTWPPDVESRLTLSQEACARTEG